MGLVIQSSSCNNSFLHALITKLINYNLKLGIFQLLSSPITRVNGVGGGEGAARSPGNEDKVAKEISLTPFANLFLVFPSKASNF